MRFVVPFLVIILCVAAHAQSAFDARVVQAKVACSLVSAPSEAGEAVKKVAQGELLSAVYIKGDYVAIEEITDVRVLFIHKKFLHSVPADLPIGEPKAAPLPVPKAVRSETKVEEKPLIVRSYDEFYEMTKVSAEWFDIFDEKDNSHRFSMCAFYSYPGKASSARPDRITIMFGVADHNDWYKMSGYVSFKWQNKIRPYKASYDNSPRLEFYTISMPVAEFESMVAAPSLMISIGTNTFKFGGKPVKQLVALGKTIKPKAVRKAA